MSLAATMTDQQVPSENPVFELWSYCPYLGCGERTNASGRSTFCGQCGSPFNVCHKCSVGNRLLASFCRGCGEKQDVEVWPMEAGLRSDVIERSSIKSVGDVQAPFPLQLGSGVQVSPIAADGLIVIGQSDGSVALVSEYTGSRLGTLSIGSPILVTPALESGVLFVASGTELRSFDIASFLDQRALQELAPIWTTRCEGEAITQPLVVDGEAIYCVTRSGQRAILYAIAQSNGSELWRTEFTLEKRQMGPPLLVHDQVVLINTAGEVNLVHPSTGEIKKSFSLNRPLDPQVQPFVVDKRVYLSDPKGYIFELVLGGSGPLINPLYDCNSRVSSVAASSQFIAVGHMAGITLLSARGHEIWSTDISESVSTTPIIAGESVFALDDSGNGLLFSVLRANPERRMKLLPGEVGMTPLITHSRIVVVGADGKVVAFPWQ